MLALFQTTVRKQARMWSRKTFLHLEQLRELVPSSGTPIRSRRVANCLGFLSVLLAITPLACMFHAHRFSDVYALTESVILIGGVGGSLATALLAGLVGSRWWLLALLGGPFDWLWIVRSVHSFSVTVLHQ